MSSPNQNMLPSPKERSSKGSPRPERLGLGAVRTECSSSGLEDRGIVILKCLDHDTASISAELLLHPTDIATYHILRIKQLINQHHPRHPRVKDQKLMLHGRELHDEDPVSGLIDTGSRSFTISLILLESKSDPELFTPKSDSMALDRQRQLISQMVFAHDPSPGQKFALGDKLFEYRKNTITGQEYLVPCGTAANPRTWTVNLHRLKDWLVEQKDKVDWGTILSYLVRFVLFFVLFGSQLTRDAIIFLSLLALGFFVSQWVNIGLTRTRASEPQDPGPLYTWISTAGVICKVFILSLFPATAEGLDE